MQPSLQSESIEKAVPSSPPELAEALDLLWVRFLPEIRNRTNILSAAAAAAVKLPEPQREAAHAAAHKLAGALGTFGLARGSELARELELAFASPAETEPSLALHLAAVTAELRTIIDNRMGTNATDEVHSVE